jgi:hypothetical protein
VTTDRRKELETSVALGETSLWIHSLAEEAEIREEVTQLVRVLNTKSPGTMAL